MKVNMDVKDEIWKKVGIVALVKKTTKSKVVEEALEAYLQRYNEVIRKVEEVGLV